MMKLKWKKLRNTAIIPKYQTKGSSGFDFHACPDEEWYEEKSEKTIMILPKSQKIVGTGLSVVIPEGLYFI